MAHVRKFITATLPRYRERVGARRLIVGASSDNAISSSVSQTHGASRMSTNKCRVNTAPVAAAQARREVKTENTMRVEMSYDIYERRLYGPSRRL